MNKKMVTAYVAENGPITVAIAGAGYMAKGFLNQVRRTDAVKVVAMASRTRQKAEALCRSHGAEDARIYDSVLALTESKAQILMDLTGDVETGAKLAEGAIEAGMHIMTSAETDATVGPMLARKARAAGVIYSNMWGDEPGLIKGLYDYADTLGLEVAVLGKFKGFHDMYATPDSVKPWADKSGQNPTVISSFADGTKLAMEMTVLSNATGFLPDVRGMHLKRGAFEDVLTMLRTKEQGGILNSEKVIEVMVGPKPGGAVFALVKTDNPEVVDALKYYKMGDGPLYMLYYPYHLPGIEMIYGLYEMMLLGKSPIEPLGDPVSDVMAVAKRDLSPGDVLGDIGYFDYTGVIERYTVSSEIGALPAGLAKGAIMVNSVKKGDIIHMADVEIRGHDTCLKYRYGGA